MKAIIPHSNEITSYKKRVLVLSYGCAGSYWLAQTLHKLENVFCAIGTDHPLSGIHYYHNQNEFNQLIDLIKAGRFQQYGFLSCDLVYNGDTINTYQLLHSMGVNVPQRCFDCNDIILDEMEDIAAALRPQSNYIINVHGLNVRTYLGSLYSLDKTIQLFDLIRHPIPTAQTWINAYLWIWNNCATRKKGLEDRRLHSAEKIKDLSHRFQVDFDDPVNLMSLYVSEHIEQLAHSFQLVECPRIRFEDLRSSPEVFSEFYKTLFGTPPDKDYLDFVFSDENLSNGRITGKPQDKKPLSPKEQFEAWTSFQQNLFSSLFSSSNICNAYKAYGYDLSHII